MEDVNNECISSLTLRLTLRVRIRPCQMRWGDYFLLTSNI
jgi:hypothetical protein